MIESFLDNTDAQDAKAKLLAQLDPLGLSRQFAPVPVPSPQSLQDWNSTLNGIPLPIRRSAPQRRVGASNGDIAAFGSPSSGPIAVAMSMMENARQWQAAHPSSDVRPPPRQLQPMIFGRNDP